MKKEFGIIFISRNFKYGFTVEIPFEKCLSFLDVLSLFSLKTIDRKVEHISQKKS